MPFTLGCNNECSACNRINGNYTKWSSVYNESRLLSDSCRQSMEGMTVPLVNLCVFCTSLYLFIQMK